MKTNKWLISCMLVVLVQAGCRQHHSETSQLPYYRSAELTPEWLSEDEVLENGAHRIEDFNLIDQEGESISATDLEGRIYVANFFFVNCNAICPTMRSNMAKVQAAYKNDEEVKLLSHSVMPEMDTVDKLKHYAQVNHVDSRQWYLLTGAREEVYELARKSYFVDFETEIEDTSLHTETFFLVDQNRNIRGIYNGTLAFDVQRLIEDIAILKQESQS